MTIIDLSSLPSIERAQEFRRLNKIRGFLSIWMFNPKGK